MSILGTPVLTRKFPCTKIINAMLKSSVTMRTHMQRVLSFGSLLIFVSVSHCNAINRIVTVHTLNIGHCFVYSCIVSLNTVQVIVTM